jgi:hypothetical protein
MSRGVTSGDICCDFAACEKFHIAMTKHAVGLNVMLNYALTLFFFS